MKLFYDINDSIDVGGGGALSPAPIVRTPSIGAAAPTTVNPLPITAPKIPSTNTNRIPLPNWNDPKSRMNYLQNWQKLYEPLEGRGDTILKLNEVPRGGSSNAKNIALQASKPYGIDPALLHASAMEEGQSGLFKDLSGKDTKGRKQGDFGYQDYFGDKEFPINGMNSYGLNTFAERFPDLVKKGYLPKEFINNFRGKAREGEFSQNDFKTPEAAMQAKAAMLKYHYDDLDSYAKQRGIKLSPKARDFFALAEYTGGEGVGHQMLNDYYNNGYLEGDKYLEKRPTVGKSLSASSYGPTFDAAGKQTSEGTYNKIMRRIKMANRLKEQGFFDDK